MQGTINRQLITMDEQELRALLDELRSLPNETEWAEIKLNYSDPQKIGEYISALSNGACLHNQQFGVSLTESTFSHCLYFNIMLKKHNDNGEVI